MRELLLALLEWGTQAILWVQRFHNVYLDGLFLSASTLGSAGFYAVLLLTLYWAVNKRLGRRLSYLLLFSQYVNSLLKVVFDIPRTTDPSVRILRQISSPAFPSGHAQSSLVLWGYLAKKIRRPWFWAGAVLLIVLISLSRVYIGVHYPVDLLGGWLVGGLFLLLWLGAIEPIVIPWISRLPIAPRLLVGIAGPLLLLFVYPRDYLDLYPAQAATQVAGALLGLNVGLLFEERYVRFAVAGNWRRRAARLPVGAAPIGVVYVLGALRPSGLPLAVDVSIAVLTFALMTFLVTGGAPWLFVRLGLAGREPAD